MKRTLSVLSSAVIASILLQPLTGIVPVYAATGINVAVATQCSDGIDNDGDGALDFPADVSCSSATDNDETNPKAACQDGVDNDGDGLVDFPQDPGCGSRQDTDESNPICSQNLVSNGSFESPGIENPYTGNQWQIYGGAVYPGVWGPRAPIPNWNPKPYQVELHRNLFGHAHTGSQYAEIDNPGSQLSQNVSTIPGDRYRISFVYAPRPGVGAQKMNVYWNNVIIGYAAGSGGSGLPWRAYSFVVTAVGNDLLGFAAEYPGGAGNQMDTVSLQKLGSCAATTQCSDGIDNDGDGASDFPADFSCASADDNDETNIMAQCQDGVDNDGDGLIDFGQDPGCGTRQDNDEFNAPIPQCSDGVDNADPEDTLADFNDIGCYTNGVYNPLDNDETNVPAVTQCNDGIDNDGDGAIDMNDFSCSSTSDTDETNPKAACQDGIDNDGDGKIDAVDPGCTGNQDNSEVDTVVSGTDVSVTKSGPPAIHRGDTVRYAVVIKNEGTSVANNVTINDQVPANTTFNQALTDSPCALQGSTVVCPGITLVVGQSRQFMIAFDVSGSVACTGVTIQNTATITAPGDSNSGNNQSSAAGMSVTCPGGPAPTPQCSDGIDNDGDGATDFPADFSCTSVSDTDETNAKASCQDGIDNDSDGLTDFPQDPGCANTQDNSEVNAAAAQCADGIDNDGDGAIDLNDFSCSGTSDTDETNPKSQCQDGIDNDGDGKIDAVDPGCAGNQDNSEVDAPVSGLDVSITKSGPPAIHRGDVVRYAVVIKNEGSVVANSVTITDPVPANTTFNAGLTDSPCALQGSTVVCPGITLVPGQSRQFMIAFTVNSGLACTGVTIQNTATVSVSGDSNSANNQSSAAGMSVTCPGGPTPSPQCSDGIDNDNDGAMDFPNDFSCSSASDNDETLPKSQCQDGIDNDGDGRVDINDPGCHTDGIVSMGIASVATYNAQDNSELDASPVGADVSIIKTGPASVMRPGTISYTVTVTNAGPGVATNVVIGDVIPAGLVFNSGASSSSCVPNGSNTSILCNNFNLNPGESRTFTIAFSAPAVQNCSPTTVSNTATVSTSSTDPVSSNNTSQTVTTTILCPVVTPAIDVSVVKTGPPAIHRGDTVRYAVIVKNEGTAVANNVTITDPVPANTTFNQGLSDAPCTLQGGNVVCSGITLVPGQSLQFMIAFNVSGTLACQGVMILNTATVSTPADGNSANNQSSAQPTAVTCPGGPPAPTTGCIDIVKETFAPNGSPLLPIAQFKFHLEDGRVTYNTSDGIARFNNVTVGSHTITEDIPPTWVLLSTTPVGGVLNVPEGPTCVTVLFKNKQVLPAFTSITRNQNEAAMSIQPAATPLSPASVPASTTSSSSSSSVAPQTGVSAPLAPAIPGRNLNFWQSFYRRK